MRTVRKVNSVWIQCNKERLIAYYLEVKIRSHCGPFLDTFNLFKSGDSGAMYSVAQTAAQFPSSHIRGNTVLLLVRSLGFLSVDSKDFTKNYNIRLYTNGCFEIFFKIPSQAKQS